MKQRDPDDTLILYAALCFSVITNICVIVYALNHLACL